MLETDCTGPNKEYRGHLDVEIVETYISFLVGNSYK
jgi:hypothetical protein